MSTSFQLLVSPDDKQEERRRFQNLSAYAIKKLALHHERKRQNFALKGQNGPGGPYMGM